ncbi:MAG: DNA primase [Ruminococcus sp.]|nr:DNA primase [Ruminococcus sp.]
MQINDEFLYRLREANPIDTVFGSYVNIIRRGRNYVCNCPFHSEKTPSCTIFMETQSFYCFGCGAGGDVITFIMKIENLSFPEAVTLLAQRSGLEVPQNDPRDAMRAKLKTRIYEMNRLAANFYYTNLIKGNNKAGLQYFAQRKLTPQTVKKYGLGFAPDSWDLLCKYLTSKGYSEDEIIAAWLGGRNRNGKLFDMFRNRVMFPIIDTRGNVLGFGGRVMDDSKPKYLNTADTPVFYKGSNLFSMNFAKNSNTKRLILCEGYMDVIAVNQAGFENVVATLGTAITPDQARLISHYAEEVIIAYDSDGAGQKATRKAINHFADVGLRTKIIHMEGAKDPDEYIKKFGANRFRMLLDGSDDANAFMLDKCEDGLDLSSDMGKVELLKRSAAVLAGIESPLEREIYISRTAKKCDIPVQVLKTHIEDILRSNRRNARKKEWHNITSQVTYKRDEINPEAVELRKEAKAEETIIYYILRFPEEADSVSKEAPPEIFLTSFNKRVYTALLNRIAASDRFTLSLLADEFTAEEMGRISGISANNRDFTIDRNVVTDCIAVLKNHKNNRSGDLSDQDLTDLFKSKISK